MIAGFPPLLAALFALCSGAASASRIEFQTVALGGPAPELLSYREFDTRQGTLDSVDIRVTGQALVRSLTAPALDGFGRPIPYTAPMLFHIGFEPVGPRGLTTLVDSTQVLTVFGTGAGGAALNPVPFDFGFSVGTRQDLGVPVFADPDGAGPASAMMFDVDRTDFLPIRPGVTGVPIYSVFNSRAQALAPHVTPVLTELSGVMRITYRYTPVEEPREEPEDPPGAVPLAPALPALAGALLALGLVRRRA